MNNNSEKSRRYRLVLFVVVPLLLSVLFIVLIAFLIDAQAHSSTIELFIAPSQSKIIFDGRVAEYNETIKVKPGEHELSISFDGFDDQTQTIQIGENEYQRVVIALIPNDPSTEDWYNTHPEDALVVSALSAQQYSQDSAEMLANYPAVEYLPIYGVNYSVGYGPCIEDSLANDTCVKITAPLGVRNTALVDFYEVDPDKDIAKYKIVFLDNYTNPFDGINQLVSSNLEGLDSSTAGDLNEKVSIEKAANAFASQAVGGYISYVAVDKFLNTDNTVAKVTVDYGTNPNDYSQTDTYSFLMAKKNGSWVPVTKLQLASTYAEYPNIPSEYIKGLMTPNLR